MEGELQGYDLPLLRRLVLGLMRPYKQHHNQKYHGLEEEEDNLNKVEVDKVDKVEVDKVEEVDDSFYKII